MFFKENLKKIRKKEGLSQESLGKILNLTRDTIASLENGRMKPSFETLINIRNYFKISLDDLIFNEIDKENN